MVAGFSLAMAIKPRCHWQKHFNRGFKAFTRERQEAFDILSNGKISRALYEVMKSAPNIRKVVFTNAPRQTKLSNAMFRECYPLEVCRLPRIDHEHFRIEPLLCPMGIGDGSQSLVRSVIMALSITTSNVRELTAEFLDDHHHYFTPSTFDMPYGQTDRVPGFLVDLTQLKMCLTINSEADKRAVSQGAVAKALASSTSLTRLYLEVVASWMITPIFKALPCSNCCLADALSQNFTPSH